MEDIVCIDFGRSFDKIPKIARLFFKNDDAKSKMKQCKGAIIDYTKI